MAWNLRWLFLSIAAFAAASGLAWLVADEPTLAQERMHLPRFEASVTAAPDPSALPTSAPADDDAVETPPADALVGSDEGDESLLDGDGADGVDAAEEASVQLDVPEADGSGPL